MDEILIDGIEYEPTGPSHSSRQQFALHQSTRPGGGNPTGKPDSFDVAMHEIEIVHSSRQEQQHPERRMMTLRSAGSSNGSVPSRDHDVFSHYPLRGAMAIATARRISAVTTSRLRLEESAKCIVSTVLFVFVLVAMFLVATIKNPQM